MTQVTDIGTAFEEGTAYAEGKEGKQDQLQNH